MRKIIKICQPFPSLNLKFVTTKAKLFFLISLQNSSHYHCTNCQETIKKIMDLAKHECRSVISAQANHYSQSTELKIIQNNNNENVNGDSARHASGSTAANCDYDDDYNNVDNADTNAGEMSGHLTDSCSSDKMNLSEMKISGQLEDKDKVSGKRTFSLFFEINKSFNPFDERVMLTQLAVQHFNA